MNRPDIDKQFDEAMRALHARSVAHISTGSMAQLHRRRHAALQGTAPPRSLFGWPAATAFASVLAVTFGIGIGLRNAAPPPAAAPITETTPSPTDSATADVVEDIVADTYATFDQNPDFLLWLGSTDAMQLAME